MFLSILLLKTLIYSTWNIIFSFGNYIHARKSDFIIYSMTQYVVNVSAKFTECGLTFCLVSMKWNQHLCKILYNLRVYSREIMLISAFKNSSRVCKGMAVLRFASWAFPFRIPPGVAPQVALKTHHTGESNFLEQLIVSEPCVEELDADYFWGCVFQSALKNTQHANLSLEKQRFPGIGSQQQAEEQNE